MFGQALFLILKGFEKIHEHIEKFAKRLNWNQHNSQIITINSNQFQQKCIPVYQNFKKTAQNGQKLPVWHGY